MFIEITQENVNHLAEKAAAAMRKYQSKNITADHGKELLAILCGFRNSHVLSSRLKNTPEQKEEHALVCGGTSIPVMQGILQKYGYTFAQDLSLDAWVVSRFNVEEERVFDSKEEAISDVWNCLMEKVGKVYGLTPNQSHLEAYLSDLNWDSKNIALLEKVGFYVSSDDRAHFYWFNGEASDDYDSEIAAWKAAWIFARKQGLISAEE